METDFFCINIKPRTSNIQRAVVRARVSRVAFLSVARDHKARGAVGDLRRRLLDLNLNP